MPAPKTHSSPAQVAANRSNAQRSTGPRTEQGKARSRANAVKHGLAGAGVALPSEDAALIRERCLRMHEEFAPTTQLGMDLVDDIALAAVRRDRCRRYLTARLHRRERDAVRDFDAQRLDLADRLVKAIEANPHAYRRQLLTMPEGVDRLVAELQMLLAELTGPNPAWSDAHHKRLDALFGYQLRDLPWGRPTRFSRAVLGDFEAIGAHEVADFPEGPARATWAEDRLIEAIAAEVESLHARRAAIDLALIAEDRAHAVDLAAFDPDRDAELARRYEATAARERSRALHDYSLSESLIAPEADLDEPNPLPGNDLDTELGSFGAAGVATDLAAAVTPEPPHDPAAAGASDPGRSPTLAGAEVEPAAPADLAPTARPAAESNDSNSLPVQDKRPELGSFGAAASAASATVPAAGVSPARAAVRAAIRDEALTLNWPLPR